MQRRINLDQTQRGVVSGIPGILRIPGMLPPQFRVAASIVLTALASALALLLASATTLAAPPPLPATFYGTAYLDGAPVPAGTAITAWIDGVQYAATSAFAEGAERVYRMEVPADDPATPAIDGGRPGDTIIFQIAGYEADQSAFWESSGFSRLDLTATTGPDLVVTGINLNGVETDPQTLLVGGTGKATIQNRGNLDVTAGTAITLTFFEDRNGDGVYSAAQDNTLGQATYTAGLTVSATAEVPALVTGEVLFRDNLVYVFVDSANAIKERDESNNVNNSGTRCEYRPPVGQFHPRLEWAWTSTSVESASLNVMMTPGVMDLNDDGIPDIVFGSTSSKGGGYIEIGVLRALSGKDGTELFTVTDPALSVNTGSSIALGDIDLDRKPEIIASDSSGSYLLAFEHDGAFKWRSANIELINWGSPAIADLDQDGVPEIVIGRQVLNNDGSVRWTGNAGRGTQLDIGALSLAADVNLDRLLEVVAGNTLYSASGDALWQIPTNDGYNAIGNFDDDRYSEIVLVSGGTIYLIEHDGMVKWGPNSIPGGGYSGAPTVADFDGDGQAEIGIAGGSSYSVFETDGSPKWSSITQDLSSGVTGASVFDFEGDGASEVVYRDEVKLRVYRGTDGAVLFEIPMSSCTWYEYPLVVDVDADANAEFVVVANNNCEYGIQQGVYVYGDANDTWVPTRSIWNQHTYHITNVNDDGTIPQFETPQLADPQHLPLPGRARTLPRARPHRVAAAVRLRRPAGLAAHHRAHRQRRGAPGGRGRAGGLL
jgi:hypothetical protein